MAPKIASSMCWSWMGLVLPCNHVGCESPGERRTRPNSPSRGLHCTVNRHHNFSQFFTICHTFSTIFQMGCDHNAPPPLSMGQNRCFCIPGMGLFELHNARKTVRLLGWRHKHPYLCPPWARKGIFEYLACGCLEWTTPKSSSGSGVAPQTPIPLYPIGQQRCV